MFTCINMFCPFVCFQYAPFITIAEHHHHNSSAMSFSGPCCLSVQIQNFNANYKHVYSDKYWYWQPTHSTLVLYRLACFVDTTHTNSTVNPLTTCCRCQDTLDPRHFGPKTFRHYCDGAEVSGHFGTDAEVSYGHHQVLFVHKKKATRTLLN